MVFSFLNGFFLGFSLIFVLGAQNIFVLRQGLIKEHVFVTAFFCAISDSILIIAGVCGFGLVFNNNFGEVNRYVFFIGGIWLTFYSLLRFKTALFPKSVFYDKSQLSKSVVGLLVSLALLTFTNPHVYLDTVILLGGVSAQYESGLKASFATGAIIASFLFFFSLAYGASFLSPFMASQSAWIIFDSISGTLMLLLAIVMFSYVI